MSMFQISGQVLHVFEQPGREDKETGKREEDKPKVQILGEIPLPNGDHRFDIVTLTCESAADFRDLVGAQVAVPIGMFSPAKGQVVYFIPKGSKPLILGASSAPKAA